MNVREALWYAQARAHGRIARQPTGLDWARLSRIGDFNLFVQQARTSPWMREMLKPVGTDASADLIELEIRMRFRRAVEDVAHWLPEGWQPAVGWTRWLIDLSAIVHLLAGAPVQAWMLRDPVVASIARADLDARSRVVQAIGLGRITGNDRELESGVFAAWLQRWRDLAPDGKDNRPVAFVEERLIRYREIIEEQATRATETSSVLTGFDKECRKVFRRQAGQITALLAYLALTWINLARLRGALLDRLLFGGMEQAAC